MAEQTRKKRRKLRRRPKDLLGGCLIVFSVLLLYSFGMRVVGVLQQREKYKGVLLEREQLQAELDSLNKEIDLLDNEDYVTRYARENYVFTQDGELPIRIP